jgi:hypothetical protein
LEAEAPRVLANAMLFELDRVADKHSFGDYVRFMDDIDVGVDSIPQAKAVVRDIDLTLQARQLRLNSSKTKILSSAKGEVADHFCIPENRFLDYCTGSVEDKTKNKAPVSKALIKAYESWRGGTGFKDSRFLRGNGDKIFKRVVILLHQLGMNLPTKDALWIIQNVPNLREICFKDLSRHKNSSLAFHAIARLFYLNVFVDDASYAYFADFIVHARFVRNNKFKAEIKKLVDKFVCQGQYMKSYSALLVASKFQDPIELVETVKQTHEFWAQDGWLGRMVGGLAPLMERDAKANLVYQDMCRFSNNVELQLVYEFHWKLRNDLSFVNRHLTYALAPNPTYPLELVYPKTLTILSIFQNPAATTQRARSKKAHRALNKDTQYQDWFKQFS